MTSLQIVGIAAFFGLAIFCVVVSWLGERELRRGREKDQTVVVSRSYIIETEQSAEEFDQEPAAI